jgi:hypothetical protein
LDKFKIEFNFPRESVSIILLFWLNPITGLVLIKSCLIQSSSDLFALFFFLVSVGNCLALFPACPTLAAETGLFLGFFTASTYPI